MAHFARFSGLSRAPVLAAAFLFLTAAKGDGCNTVIVAPDLPDCPMGHHVEEVCQGHLIECPDGADCAQEENAPDCSLQCVPDEPSCPPGYVAEVECLMPPIDCPEGAACEVEPVCSPACVPVGPCPQGFVEVVECAAPLIACADGNPNCNSELKCSAVCVPSGECAPGEHLETQCSSPPCPEGEACPAIVECIDVCVGDPLCAEGLVAVEVCLDGDAVGAPCSIECVEPVDGGEFQHHP
jgi:hypothetical protein